MQEASDTDENDIAESGQARQRIRQVIADEAFAPVYQRIVDLRTGTTVGYEALTRFRDGCLPGQRFREAHAVDMGVALESACARAAIRDASGLHRGTWLSLNISPELAQDTERLHEVLRYAPHPVVVELTGYSHVTDHPALVDALRKLRRSVRLAVDAPIQDAGEVDAQNRIRALEPDFVKLDMAVVRTLPGDTERPASIAATLAFARRTGCSLIAEAIETAAEAADLAGLEIEFGQGYYLGRPARPARPEVIVPPAASGDLGAGDGGAGQ